MKLAAARAMLALAAHCLGMSRRDWAMAMEAELSAAAQAGEALSFAWGCLVAAWREMPAHEEGRFALASHSLAAGIVVPMAALLLSSVAFGFSFLTPRELGLDPSLGSGRPIFVNYANQAGLPLMALVTLVLGIGHLLMAWAMLERDWRRVAAIGRIGAALTVTMVIFTGILFIYEACALPGAAAIVLELAAIHLLVRWHEELPHQERLDAFD